MMRKRPFSYKEEIRLEEQYFGRPDSRLRRTQSLSPVRNMSPVRGQSYPNTYREPYRDSYRNYYREQYPYEYMDRQGYRHNDRDSYRRYEPDTYRGGRAEESPRLTKEQRIMQLSQQLRDLETKYEITRDGLASNERPWLDRFLKMAQALYNSDIANKGCLPRKDVLDIVNQYNNAFNLNLDMTRANMLAISPDNIDKSGNIILKNFLASLSVERISYKV